MPVGLNSDVFAAGVSASDEARLAAEIVDLHLPHSARLDDRTRLAISRTLAELVGGIEADLRRHAARLLAGRHADAAAEALMAEAGTVLARLTAAGVLRDPELMEEVIAGVRGALIAAALPPTSEAEQQPSLLVRLADLPDGIVAAAAQALLAADSRRAGSGSDLPADLHHRLVWWVAAAVRPAGGDAVADPSVDRALADAAQRCLAAHDEGERPEALAARLAAAIDPLPTEVPALLVEALGDRRLTLFVAVLARALGIEADVARLLVLEPEGERLWPCLRAIGLARREIARIALSLADADPRRDIEAFADRLDGIAAIDPSSARTAIESLALPRDFRLAITALDGRRR